MREALVVLMFCALFSKSVYSLKCYATDPALLKTQNFTNLNHTSTECVDYLKKIEPLQESNNKAALSCFLISLKSSATQKIVNIRGCALQSSSCDALQIKYLALLPKDFADLKNIEQKCHLICDIDLCNSHALETGSSSTKATATKAITKSKDTKSKSSCYQVPALLCAFFLTSHILL